MPVPQLTDDQMCFGCGSRNPRGLKLSFEVDKKSTALRCTWTPGKEYQGYADIVHGGVLGVVLDEVMGNLLYLNGRPAVTAEMTVRFHKPAHVGKPLRFEAHLGSIDGRRIQMEADAKTESGVLVASAQAKFVSMEKK